MISPDTHLQIGSLLFEGLDQIDLTGPFEVFSRIPNSTYRVFGRTTAPVRDLRGLRLMADAALTEAPQLDLLHVPGGFGQEALMDDEDVLTWVRDQAAGVRCLFSVCTGALICGAAGLLKGRRATTHWASMHLLPFFGAIPVNKRVVTDGNSCVLPGSRPASTVHCRSRLICAASKWRRPSSLVLLTRPSRHSTAVLRSQRRPPS